MFVLNAYIRTLYFLILTKLLFPTKHSRLLPYFYVLLGHLQQLADFHVFQCGRVCSFPSIRACDGIRTRVISCLEGRRPKPLDHTCKIIMFIKQVMGIEPTPQRWQRRVLADVLYLHMLH